MAQKVSANALTSTDVRGKRLYYIKLENENGKTYFINVGEKTYNECAKMQNEQQESPKKATS